MKYLNIITLSVVLLIYGPAYGTPESKISYEIQCIDSVNNYYLIQVQRNDSVFLVLSIKSDFKNTHKLKIGAYYNLKLKSVCTFDLIQKQDLSGIEYDGILIDFSDYVSVIHDLFICERIKGLYIQKE